MSSRRPRTELRNLPADQKLLVLVIIMAVGGGYLAALINLFAQHSASDGVSTLSLDDFPKSLRENGVVGTLKKVQESLGVNDVIKHYHGSGAGVTRLESALNGSMKDMIIDTMAENTKIGDDEKKLAEVMRQDLIWWTKLGEDEREAAYEKGVPADEKTGGVDRVKFLALLEKPDDKVELTPLIKTTFDDNCVRCHSPNAPDAQAKKIPLNTLETVNAYVVEDHGVSYKHLALTTHVHLLGFSVLFAVSGFMFSLTSFPTFIRAVFVPWTLFFQVIEICCWWLAKSHVGFAYAIFYLGPLIGLGLGVQLLGTFIDLLIRRPRPMDS